MASIKDEIIAGLRTRGVDFYFEDLEIENIPDGTRSITTVKYKIKQGVNPRDKESATATLSALAKDCGIIVISTDT